MLTAEGRVGLAEVTQQVRAQTVGRGAIERHLLEALAVPRIQQVGRLGVTAARLKLVSAAIDKELAGLHVLLVVDEDAVGSRPVTSGASRLLIITFEVRRHVVVDDKADVGLVDAHAEGVGGHHHVCPVVEELLLVGMALLRGKAGVIARGGKTLLPQQLADVFHGFARGAIHDARLARLPRLTCGIALCGTGRDETQKRAILVTRLRALHSEVEVRPVEAAHEHEGVAQLEGVHDVAAHLLGGGRREGGHGGAGRQALHEPGDGAVVGAEVLPPLRHAVRLVHGHERDARNLGKLGHARRGEALGCHVEQLHVTRQSVRKGPGLLVGALGAVDARGGNPSLLQARYLVFHKRDERGHHKCEPRQQQRGYLVDHRLAGAGGHDAKHVAAGKHLFHQVALVGTEVVVTEPLLEGGAGILHGGHLGSLRHFAVWGRLYARHG